METYAENVKLFQARDKARILALLGINEEIYFWQQVDEADAYLNRLLNGDAEAIQVMKDSLTFWTWWKDYWSRMDNYWLTVLDDKTAEYGSKDIDTAAHFTLSRHRMRAAYNSYHMASALDKYPTHHIFEAAKEEHKLKHQR